MQIAALFGLLAFNMMVLLVAGAILDERLPETVLILLAWERLRLRLRCSVVYKVDSRHGIVLGDRSPLKLAIVVRLTFLEFIRLYHLTVEAVHFMVLHAALLPGDLWDVLDKANHGLRAVRVKLFIVAGLEGFERHSAFLSCRHNRILRNIVFKIVAEVCDETLAVFELDVQCLIVDSSPVAFNQVLVARRG